MARCRKCGTELNDGDKFCVYCGAKQEDNQGEEKIDDGNDTRPHDVVKDEIEDDKNHEKDDDKFSSHKVFGKHKSGVEDEDYDDEDEDVDEDMDDTHKLDDDQTVRKSGRGKLKILAITIVTIIVFIGVFKVSSAFINKGSGKNTSNIESKQDTSSDSNSSNNSNDSTSNSTGSTSNDNSSSNDESSNSSEYILPFSSKREVTSSDLKGLSEKQLLLASNEIFARHGYKFPSDPYKSYFESKPWYKVNPNYTSDTKELSPLERHNVKTILKAAGKHVAQGYDADYYKNK